MNKHVHVYLRCYSINVFSPFFTKFSPPDVAMDCEVLDGDRFVFPSNELARKYEDLSGKREK